MARKGKRTREGKEKARGKLGGDQWRSDARKMLKRELLLEGTSRVGGEAEFRPTEEDMLWETKTKKRILYNQYTRKTLVQLKHTKRLISLTLKSSLSFCVNTLLTLLKSHPLLGSNSVKLVFIPPKTQPYQHILSYKDLFHSSSRALCQSVS